MDKMQKELDEVGTKFKIEKNSVQETLVLPLYGKAYCMKQYPDLFHDEDCVRIVENLDYDFSAMEAQEKSLTGKIGALSATLRQYSIVQEVKAYLKEHPKAAVVNLGCGLDAAGHQADTGTCFFYNIDHENVIELRNQLLPGNEREKNIACDINDYSWFDQIDFKPEDGVVFFATGVFLYFKRDEVKNLFCALAERFPGGRITFDGENQKGVEMDLKTLKKSGVDISTNFGLDHPVEELSSWSDRFEKVSWKGLMTAYMKPDKRFGTIFRIMAKYSDKKGMSQLDTIDFKKVATGKDA